MTLRRKIYLGLLILPAAASFVSLLWPGTGAELIFLVIGLPILVLNVWEFFLGENSGAFFDLSRRPASSEGSIMRSKLIMALLILSAVFILLVAGYTASRAAVDEIPYSLALYTFLIKLGSKLWHFLSLPVTFIALLLFVLLLVFGPQLIPLLRKWQSSSTDVPFPDVFARPIQSPFAEIVSQSEDDKKPLALERMIAEGLDLKAIQLMLEVDGIDLTKPLLVNKLSALGLHSESLPADASPAQREAFFRGLSEGLYGCLLPLFCAIETKNEAKTARFTLKPGLRERLVERLNQGNKPPEPLPAS